MKEKAAAILFLKTLILLSLSLLVFRPHLLSSRLQEGRSPDVVDCIVASVDSQVITLTDVRILEAFGLHEETIEPGSDDVFSAILRKVIEQKVILSLARERILLEKEEVDGELELIRTRKGEEAIRRTLDAFDLEWEDLRPYVEEKLLARKIIGQRFGQSVFVSLREIEAYYLQTYVPLQEQEGLNPLPMVQLLDEIETAVRREKMNKQVASWIENLRKQAEIEVRDDCLKNMSRIRE